MKQVDMSDKAVTARLKLVGQLRRLGLSLQKAKLPPGGKTIGTRAQQKESAKPTVRKSK